MKYWLSVSDSEQERRFQKRLTDPRKRWKFSPVDLQARARWVDYAEAKDRMFARTDTDHSPWYVVEGDDKRTARLNLISHLLSLLPYEHVAPPSRSSCPPPEARLRAAAERQPARGPVALRGELSSSRVGSSHGASLHRPALHRGDRGGVDDPRCRLARPGQRDRQNHGRRTPLGADQAGAARVGPRDRDGPLHDDRRGRPELVELRAETSRRARGVGLEIGASGTHPFARWEDQRVVSDDRYRGLIRSLGFVASQELVFGMHVHVGMADPEETIAVANNLRPHVPLLIALGANSPLWRGGQTGLMSSRVPIFRAFPRVGLPPLSTAGMTLSVASRCFPRPG